MYAPTLQAEAVIKEAFYHDLHNLMQQVDSKDKLIIFADYNQEWDETLNCGKES